jgi:RNA polymerase sigma-70 factor (ECF subfamily)
MEFDELMTRLRAGDEDAAAVVFRRFVRRLVGLAGDQFETRIRSRADPEGVVQSAYRSFFARYEQGQLDPADWESLWGLLTVITLRKCANRRDYLRARRRDVRRDTAAASQLDRGRGEVGLVDREPSPVEAAILSETVEALLRSLEPPERGIIELTLAGWSTAEIAAQLGRSGRSVRRVREQIKHHLMGRITSSPHHGD